MHCWRRMLIEGLWRSSAGAHRPLLETAWPRTLDSKDSASATTLTPPPSREASRPVAGHETIDHCPTTPQGTSIIAIYAP